LTITDLSNQNPFSIKRPVLPAWDASEAQLKEANRERAAFMRPAKDRVDAINHPVRNSISRDDIIDSDAKALGEHIRRETKQYEHEQSAEKRQFARLTRGAQASGFRLPDNVLNPDRVLEGIQLWNQSAAEIENQAASGNDHVPAPSIADAIKAGEAVSGRPRPTPGVYWRLWSKVEKTGCNPNLRHDLTQKHLGCHPNINEMSEAQLAKMIDVFSAILRDTQAAIP